jgi:predicted nucleotidyltransferase component of viral defense system
MQLIEQMLQNKNAPAGSHALREVMQEIALLGLQRGGFFEKAAFYGGTCLRIFHDLPRFSEDLDFSLLRSDASFSFAPYFKAIEREFESLGFTIDITEKIKSAQTPIVSAFLKKSSSVYDLKIQGQRTIKIKFEVDTEPPLGFVTEERLQLQPYTFYVKCFDLPSLFAGKVHALLYRKWKNRIKGRDWFDFEWYVRNGHNLSLAHFTKRAQQSGHLQSSKKSINGDAFKLLLAARIAEIDFESAKADVVNFVPDPKALGIWSKDYFHALVNRMKLLP